jgi:hypothetical protein
MLQDLRFSHSGGYEEFLSSRRSPFHDDFLLGSLFNLYDGGDVFLRNVS